MCFIVVWSLKSICFVILVYDINLEEKEGLKVLRKVFKTCKKYLIHIQNSVFEGELLESQAIQLNIELGEYIRKDKDSVIMFKSRNQKWLDKEFIGKIEEDKTSNFLWLIYLSILNKVKNIGERQLTKYYKMK